MPVVSAQVVFDFRNVPDTNNWTHPDLVILGGSLNVKDGILRKNSTGTLVVFHKNTGEAVITSYVESENKANFDYGAPGAFTDTGEGFVAAPSGGQIRILKISQSGTLSGLDDADYGTGSYSASDIIGLEYSDTADTLRSLKNGSTITTKDTDTYSGLLRPGIVIKWGNANSNGVRSFGFDGVFAVGLGEVGSGNSFRQGQKNVRIKINGLPSSAVESLTIAGEATAFTTDGPEHIKFDAPFDLNPGPVSVAATIDGINYTKDSFQVQYVRTHPFKAVPSGASVDTRSIASEIDNPGARYLSFSIPSALQFLSPFTKMDEAAQSARLDTVLAAKTGTPENTIHVITGSALDQDGTETPFEIEIISRSIDRTPKAKSFAVLTDQPLDTEFTSDSILIEDIDDEVVLSVETIGVPTVVSVNGVENATTAIKGDSINLTLRSSPEFETTSEAALLLDGIEFARFSVTTIPDPGDIFPPVLVEPLTPSALYHAGFFVTFSLDELATYRAVVVPASETAPTAAEVWAGTRSGGAAAPYDSKFQQAVPEALNTLQIGGLTEITDYVLYLVAEDPLDNQSEPFTLEVTTKKFRPVDKDTKIRMVVLPPGENAKHKYEHDGKIPPNMYDKTTDEEISVAVEWARFLPEGRVVDAFEIINDETAGLIIIDDAVSEDGNGNPLTTTYVKLVGGYPTERATILTQITSGDEVYNRDFVVTMRDY